MLGLPFTKLLYEGNDYESVIARNLFHHPSIGPVYYCGLCAGVAGVGRVDVHAVPQAKRYAKQIMLLEEAVEDARPRTAGDSER